MALLVVVALVVGACSTPNLKPFADGAASFSTAIKLTNAAVETKFGEVAERQERMEDKLIKYRNAVRIYDEMAGLAAGYSTALADLGAAGETGGDAAEQILQTVNGFSQFLNLGFPGAALPASLAGSAAGRAIRQAAKCWTRLEVQENLLDTMNIADQAVQALAIALIEVYGQPFKSDTGAAYRPFERIVRDVALFERMALKKNIGGETLSFHEEATEFLNTRVYGSASSALEAGDAAGAARVFTDNQAIIDEKARIDDEVAAYRKAEKAVRDWQARQLKASYLIADTAKAWAAEHQRLLGWFRTCGGHRFLQGKCGQFSAATLKALAAEIQVIIKGD